MRIGKKTTPWGKKVICDLVMRGWEYEDLANAMTAAGIPYRKESIAQIINGSTPSLTGMRNIGDFLNIPPEV